MTNEITLSVTTDDGPWTRRDFESKLREWFHRAIIEALSTRGDFTLRCNLSLEKEGNE